MDNLPVNALDIAVGVVLLTSAGFAYMRGFVHEVLSVGAWIGAIFATIYGFSYLRPYARDLIAIELAADLAAGVVLFVLSLAILSLLTRRFSQMVKESALNFLDRSLGFLFGLVRGAVIVCIAYIALSWFMPPAEQPTWVNGARSITLIRPGADILRALVPDHTASRGSKAASEIERKTEKLLESQRVFRDMLDVEPKAPSNAAESGYSRQERNALERLIQGNQ